MVLIDLDDEDYDFGHENSYYGYKQSSRMQN